MTNDKHLEVGKIIYEAVGGLHAMGAVKGTGMAFTQEKNGTFQFSHLPSKKENAKPVNHTKISLNDDNLYDIQLSNVENGEQIPAYFLDNGIYFLEITNTSSNNILGHQLLHVSHQ